MDGFLQRLESDTHKTDGTAGNTEVPMNRDETISQRVDMHFHLQALSNEETTAYIARHLAAVKAPGE